MAIKTIVPRSRGKRKIILIDYKKHLTTDTSEKSLRHSIHNGAGRNNQGQITIRFRGGKNKRQYRLVDFKRDIIDIPATVKTVEYDPNRTAFISLIVYANGKKAYILSPRDIKIGDQIISSDLTDVKIGNCMKIKNIPEGTLVHNIEFIPGAGAQIARSAGCSAQVLGKDETGEFTIVKLSSKEVRKIPNDARATIGSVSNEDHNIINLGKAGKNRYLGRKPSVRGSAMNPNDHPHGGGEGRQGVGRDAPRTP
jgi:large subunit ribosomal protein L2